MKNEAVSFQTLNGGDNFLNGSQHYIKVKQAKASDDGLGLNMTTGELKCFRPNSKVEKGFAYNESAQILGSMLMNSTIAV